MKIARFGPVRLVWLARGVKRPRWVYYWKGTSKIRRPTQFLDIGRLRIFIDGSA